MTIVHHVYACPGCEADGALLYHFGRDNGATTEVAHGCEHYIRDSYPDDPPPAEWLAQRAVPPGAGCVMRPAQPDSAATPGRVETRCACCTKFLGMDPPGTWPTAVACEPCYIEEEFGLPCPGPYTVALEDEHRNTEWCVP